MDVDGEKTGLLVESLGKIANEILSGFGFCETGMQHLAVMDEKCASRLLVVGKMYLNDLLGLAMGDIDLTESKVLELNENFIWALSFACKRAKHANEVETRPWIEMFLEKKYRYLYKGMFSPGNWNLEQRVCQTFETSQDSPSASPFVSFSPRLSEVLLCYEASSSKEFLFQLPQEILHEKYGLKAEKESLEVLGFLTFAFLYQCIHCLVRTRFRGFQHLSSVPWDIIKQSPAISSRIFSPWNSKEIFLISRNLLFRS